MDLKYKVASLIFCHFWRSISLERESPHFFPKSKENELILSCPNQPAKQPVNADTIATMVNYGHLNVCINNKV